MFLSVRQVKLSLWFYYPEKNKSHPKAYNDVDFTMLGTYRKIEKKNL